MGSKPRFNAARPGVWQALFVHGQALMDEMCARTRPDALWTFGGGTVLMLRHGHRLSKDIDLFVPDPQYLGFVNPRLSDVAAVRHRDAFLAQLDERRAVLASQFEAIDALRPMPEYDDCVAQARSFLSALPG